MQYLQVSVPVAATWTEGRTDGMWSVSCSSFQPVLSLQPPLTRAPHPSLIRSPCGKFLKFHNVTRLAVHLSARTPTPTLILFICIYIFFLPTAVLRR